MKRIFQTLPLMGLLLILLLLGGCGQKKQEVDVDPQLENSILEQSNQLFLRLYSMSEEELLERIAQAESEKDANLAAGLENFHNALKDVGPYVSTQDMNVKKSDEGYLVTIHYTGENRTAVLVLGLDSKLQQITQISVNPHFSTMEKMEKAVLNTVLGMGTVFIILIFISFLIGLFRYISVAEKYLKERKEKQAKTQQVEEIPVVLSSPPSEEETGEEAGEEEELVAVITAAIAQASGSEASGLIVRSIRRVKR